MNSIANGSVIIQTSSKPVLSMPCWFGEATLIVEHLRKHGVLSASSERVRGYRGGVSDTMKSAIFSPSRSRYAISGERTLEAFYEGIQPFAPTFMALFDRDQLPARSTLARFLTALRQEPVEALRSLFLDDLESRPLSNERQTGGLADREGFERVVFAIDGTREAARVSRPTPDRRAATGLSPIGYSLCCWLRGAQARGSCADPHCCQSGPQLKVGSARLARRSQWALPAGTASVPRGHRSLPRCAPASAGASRAPARWAIWHRSRAGGSGWLLVRDAWQRLHRVGSSARPGGSRTCPQISSSIGLQSQLVRSLYDCPDVPVGSLGVQCRVVVATHPTSTQKSRVGVTRSGSVYELFFTDLPPQAFPVTDVVELYLHRGAFEPARAAEDVEQDPDRWCSQSPSGRGVLADRFTMGLERGAWNWGIRLSQPPCARPSLLLPSRLSSNRLPTRLLLRLAMAHPPPPPPGKLAAFLERTLPSNPTGH
jgi:hypothetical protein